MRPGDDKHEAILLGLEMTWQMDQILNDHPTTFTLPREAYEKCKACGLVFLSQFNFLAQTYNTDGDLVFNVTVKCHMLCHIILRSHELNLRRVWCFSGERFMPITRKLTQSCVRGTSSSDAAYKIMTKHRHGLDFVLAETGEWASSLIVEEKQAGAGLMEYMVDRG